MMEPIGLLEAIVSTRSVFPDEAGLARFLAKELERCGFQVEIQRFGDDRYNVLATRGIVHGAQDTERATQDRRLDAGDRKPLLLYGHMDTVPPYGYEDRDPFRLEERDGKLYGLGAYDMKAGLAAIMCAVDAVRDGRPLKVMFVSDEEADSRGCFEAVEWGFVRGCSFALAAEISDVHDTDEKTRTITLGRRGRVQYEITVPGKSFHAARAEEGISALTQAAKIAVELERVDAELPRHPRLSKGSQFVRSFSSSSESLSLPDSATLLVDRHLVFPETAESAREGIQARIDRMYDGGELRDADGKRAAVAIKPRDVPYMMPFVTDESDAEVERLVDAIKKTLGTDARFNYGMSVADENMLAMQGVPTASFGPIGGGEHSAGEWVSKKSYLELIEVLKRFIS